MKAYVLILTDYLTREEQIIDYFADKATANEARKYFTKKLELEVEVVPFTIREEFKKKRYKEFKNDDDNDGDDYEFGCYLEGMGSTQVNPLISILKNQGKLK